MVCCILAPLAVASRRVPLAPSIFGCFARHRDGVADRSRASRARESARASRAVSRLSRRSSSRRRWFVAFSRHSRVHLSVCLWRRRSSVASLVIATARWIARAPLALTCRLAPHAPSRVSRVARRLDGDGSLHSRAIRGCLSVCASRVVGLRSLRSSSRRRRGSLACFSRSRFSLRLPHRRTSPALLVVTTAMNRCILAPFAVVSRRVPLAPSIFGCFARHRDGVVDCLCASRARVSACATRAVARLSRSSSSRR